MSTYVYVLSRRGAKSSEQMIATHDRQRLPDLLCRHWPVLYAKPGGGANSAPVACVNLRRLLGFADADLAQQVGHVVHRANRHNNQDDVQLHVLEVS